MRTLLTKYTYGAYDESLSVNAALFGFGISTVTCLLSGKSLAKDLDDFMAASTDLATLGSSVGCFVAGTIVKTEEGDKVIEEIKAGDKVLSYEATTGRFAYKEVAEVIAHGGVTELAHVTVGGETIDSTTNHPYFVVGYGYVDAGKLIEGDIVLLANGGEAKVEKVEIEFLDEPVTVYNFEVKDWHCYFVGEAGVLVHNVEPICKDTGKVATSAGGKTEGNSGEGGTGSKFNDLLNSEYYKTHPGFDCSEIAEEFYDAANRQGKIYRIEGKNGIINGYEYGNIEEYLYHEVYSDGINIYDPRYSNMPVPKRDYFRMLREINIDGFDVFERIIE